MKMKFNLQYLRQRREQAFGWVNATQFFGALNDNIFKAFIQMFLIVQMPDSKGRILAMATILFSLPYIFLTPFAGYLADRFSKKTITVILKYTEFVIMNKLWPDFTEEDLDEAIKIFNQRNRRFGGV